MCDKTPRSAQGHRQRWRPSTARKQVPQIPVQAWVVKWPASCQCPGPSQVRCVPSTTTATPVLSGSQERLCKKDFPHVRVPKIRVSMVTIKLQILPRGSRGGGGGKLAYPQRSGHGWRWGRPLWSVKAEQSRAAPLGMMGKSWGC